MYCGKPLASRVEGPSKPKRHSSFLHTVQAGMYGRAHGIAGQPCPIFETPRFIALMVAGLRADQRNFSFVVVGQRLRTNFVRSHARPLLPACRRMGSRCKLFCTVASGRAEPATATQDRISRGGPTPENFLASALQAPRSKGVAFHHPLYADGRRSVIAVGCA